MTAFFISKEKNVFTTFSNWIIFISGVCTTLLLSSPHPKKYLPITLSIAAAALFYFIIIKKIQNDLLIGANKKVLIFSIVASLFAEIPVFGVFYHNCQSEVTEALKKLGIEGASALKATYNSLTFLITILSAVFISACLYIIYTKALKLFGHIYGSFEKAEKIAFFSVFGFYTLLIVVSYSLTYVFWGTQQFNGILYDVIYTSDSGNLFSTNCYLDASAPENDLRQPLFGVFGAPFAVIPYAISRMFNYVQFLYPLLLAIEQCFLLHLSLALIVKMLKISKGRIYVYLIFSVSFPALLFSLNLEQYIFALFWLILFLYSAEIKSSDEKGLFLAATGSILTNAALFPLLYKKELKLKNNIINYIKLAIAFVLLCFVFGRGICFLTLKEKIDHLQTFTGEGILMVDKLKQYSAFIFACFMFPPSHVVGTSIQQMPATNFNLFGIAILVLCIVGFVLNRKNKFAMISFAWICFSILMLVLIGWGAKENGMILYTLYFGWAFISLLVMLINKIPEKLTSVKYGLYSILVVTLLYFNVQGYIEIMKIGITNFPG